MQRGRRVRKAAWIAGALAAIGCAKPTVEDSARKVWSAYCDRVQQCSADGFLLEFADHEDCVQRGVNGIPPDELGGRSACSDDEVSGCVDAIARGRCPRLVDWDVADGGPINPEGLPAGCKPCAPTVLPPDAAAD